MKLTKKYLEKEYEKYNNRKFVHPDPLEFLYSWPRLEDREIVGLVASSLAYGRVAQILKSVENALSRMEKPTEYVKGTSFAEMKRDFKGFKHRFTTGEEMARLLSAASAALAANGSIGGAFKKHFRENDDTFLPALKGFSRFLLAPVHGKNSLVPDPELGSACKRMNLYLRWMVRRDAVDPGGWDFLPMSKLIVPLDTHMHRFALGAGLTIRKNADMRAALEITAGFAEFSPEDPVKYDFALTRPGIQGMKNKE